MGFFRYMISFDMCFRKWVDYIFNYIQGSLSDPLHTRNLKMDCVYIGEAGTLCWTHKQNVLFFFSSLFLGEVNMYPEKLNLKRSTCLLSTGCLGNHTAVSLCHEGLSLSGIESVYIMSASANCLVMNVVPTSSSLAFEGALCLPANGRIINKHDRGWRRDFCMENMLVLPTCVSDCPCTLGAKFSCAVWVITTVAS